MDGDFGVDIDAALNDGIAALHGAAQAARERVDRGLAGLEASAHPQREIPPAADPSPMIFDDGGDHRRHGAPVSFDLPDDDLPVDDEGIPFPEENS
ncbi:MAG TPA: hypothetical protein VKR05_00605 [Candidatus Cybelea sp.]|nr:hypothetical protein [Candidatus Cybelea sp.]